MIALFPSAYPDELLYSQISRYHQRCGYARLVFTLEDVYKAGKIAHPSIEFVNPYTDDAMYWLTKEMSWKTVAEKHTMYPAFIRFLPLQRRKEAEEGIINQNGNWKNLMCLPVLNEKRFLCFCPECAREDREKYGETYWHREHQIPRIRVCPKHRVFLENSNVPNNSRGTPGLFDAESNVPECTVLRGCENFREIDFTQFVIDVFKSPVDIETDFGIGSYLHSKLLQKYKNKSGIIRKLSRLYDDYLRFYTNMPVMTQSYMQKIFNGYIYDAYYTLQLAFFEEISVYDITHIPHRGQAFDELYKRLSEKHNIDYFVVADIAQEVIKQNNHKASNISGPRRKAYDKLDEELLPKVKKLVDEIVGKEGKPERVSPTKIQRLMNLPQRQFNKLQKCKGYIDSKTETQEEYWKRKIEWAVKEIEKENRVVTLTNIMHLTNMRKNQVISSAENINIQL